LQHTTMKNDDQRDKQAADEAAESDPVEPRDKISRPRHPLYIPKRLPATGSKSTSELLAEDRKDRKLTRRPRPG
jgi:hypothetical protein